MRHRPRGTAGNGTAEKCIAGSQQAESTGCPAWKHQRRAGHRAAGILLLGSVLGIAGSVQAQYVRVQPPPPVVERPYQAPGRGFVWIPGYQRWDGHHYQWSGGRWVHPPRPAAVWEPGRWERSPAGWLWVPGRWRG